MLEVFLECQSGRAVFENLVLKLFQLVSFVHLFSFLFMAVHVKWYFDLIYLLLNRLLYVFEVQLVVLEVFLHLLGEHIGTIHKVRVPN